MRSRRRFLRTCQLPRATPDRSPRTFRRVGQHGRTRFLPRMEPVKGGKWRMIVSTARMAFCRHIFFAHTACPGFAGNVIVEASHHLRKMQAHCSWLHLFEHARWLHAGLSASPARLCSRARDIPAHASLAYSYQRSAGPTIPIKSRMESNSRISNECTTT